jgi:hypothetical protein
MLIALLSQPLRMQPTPEPVHLSQEFNIARFIHCLYPGKVGCLLLQSFKEPLVLPRLLMCLPYLLLHRPVVSGGFTTFLKSKGPHQGVRASSLEVHHHMTFKPTPSTTLIFLIHALDTPLEIKQLITTSML